MNDFRCSQNLPSFLKSSMLPSKIIPFFVLCFLFWSSRRIGQDTPTRKASALFHSRKREIDYRRREVKIFIYTHSKNSPSLGYPLSGHVGCFGDLLDWYPISFASLQAALNQKLAKVNFNLLSARAVRNDDFCHFSDSFFILFLFFRDTQNNCNPPFHLLKFYGYTKFCASCAWVIN